MRRSLLLFTLLRMQFSSANQTNHIFYRYQGHSRCHKKKKHVALGEDALTYTEFDYATLPPSIIIVQVHSGAVLDRSFFSFPNPVKSFLSSDYCFFFWVGGGGGGGPI